MILLQAISILSGIHPEWFDPKWIHREYLSSQVVLSKCKRPVESINYVYARVAHSVKSKSGRDAAVRFIGVSSKFPSTDNNLFGANSPNSRICKGKE
jgi:hypothetical protein